MVDCYTGDTPPKRPNFAQKRHIQHVRASNVPNLHATIPEQPRIHSRTFQTLQPRIKLPEPDFLAPNVHHPRRSNQNKKAIDSDGKLSNNNNNHNALHKSPFCKLFHVHKSVQLSRQNLNREKLLPVETKITLSGIRGRNCAETDQHCQRPD